MQKLLQLLKGKNTIEAAHALSEAFVLRFGTEQGTPQEIASKLIPRGKSPTWASLDKNLNLLCRQFYENWQSHEDKINFLDEARFTIQTLPQRQDYKLPPEKLELKDPKKAQEYFTTCAHCWRTAMKKPLQKVKALCHLHDLPSTHREYRKRERLKKHQEIIKRNLLKSMPPLSFVKKKQGAEQNKKLQPSEHIEESPKSGSASLNDYVFSLCLNKKGPLPYLASYLITLNQSHAVPISTTKEVLQALEYPIKNQALDFYLTDLGEHFRLNYLRLLNTEAWLQTEAIHTHGGKRR